MKYILKTNKLLINPQNSKHNAFIYSGSPNEGQKNKGKLIVLLDFPESTANPKELGNILIQKIHKLYYKSNVNDQEAVLENILEEVNENLPIITEADNNWIKKFNALIAVIYRQEVYFSPLGNISAWTTNNDKLVNIFDYLDNNIDKPSVNKIFTNILSGNIEAKQLLFFTTNTIFDYLAKNKIKKIVIENKEPANIILKLKELLQGIKNKSFCLVSIKLSPYIPKQVDNFKKSSPRPNNIGGKIKINISSQQSINKLLESQQATEEILNKGKSSIITSNSQNEVKTNPINTIDNTANDKYLSKIKTNKTKHKNHLKTIIQYFNTYLSALKLIFRAPYIFIKKTINHKRNIKNQQNKATKNISTPPTPLSNKALRKIAGSKTIVIVAVIILIAFISSIFFINYQKKLQLKKENYKKILKNINNKQEEYNLLLIYNDSDQAKNKLNEISDLINKLPQKTAEQKEKYKDIVNKFTKILNKTRKLNTIAQPEVIAKFNFKPIKIIKHGNNLIALGANANQFSTLDLKTKKISNKHQNDVDYKDIKSFAKDKNFIYGLDNNDQVVKIDLDQQSAKEMLITYHPNYKQADDLAVYNGRIYILDAQSNQIYKHNQRSESFSKGKAWVKDGTKINNGTAITIDGNIYLATNNGKIEKFYTGKLTDFAIEKIDPTVNNIDKIFTDQTINEIYILDKQSKRIIIINKKGSLINQFYFPTLNMINNFVIDGASQKVYLQSDNKIISLDLNSLKE